MSGHTPGPWSFQHCDGDSCDYEVVQPFINGDVIAGEYGIELRADAQLIAAAPDLLEACHAFLDAMRTSGASNGAIRNAEDAAIAAIAKATAA